MKRIGLVALMTSAQRNIAPTSLLMLGAWISASAQAGTAIGSVGVNVIAPVNLVVLLGQLPSMSASTPAGWVLTAIAQANPIFLNQTLLLTPLCSIKNLVTNTITDMTIKIENRNVLQCKFVVSVSEFNSMHIKNLIIDFN